MTIPNTPRRAADSPHQQDYTSWSGYFRVLDHRETLHLATASMHPSQAMCGEPPHPNEWSDPAPEIFPPNTPAPAYARMCPVCTFAAS